MPTENDSRHRGTFNLLFIALVTATVLFRFGLSLILPRTIKDDEAIYLLLGYNLFRGNGFTYSGYPELHFSPLYPIVAELFHWLTGDFEMASNLVYALCGGLLLFPVFSMAQRIYNARTAWVAAVFVAIFPALTVYVLYWGSLTEPLYLLLLYGGLAVLLSGLENGRPRMLGAAGLLLGLAYLTRPEAVVYICIFSVVLWFWSPARLNFLWRSYNLAAFICPFILMAFPYIWYLHTHTGQWLISGKIAFVFQQIASKKGYIYFDQMPGGEIALLSPDRFQLDTQQWIVSNLGYLFERVIKTARKFKDQFFSGGNFWWGLTPLVAVALFNKPWEWRRFKFELFLIAIILVLFFTFLPFFFLPRLFAPAFPVLLIWTARGALDLGEWLRGSVELWAAKPFYKSSRVLGWLPAGAVLGVLLLTIPVAAEGLIKATFFGDKEAGLWLKTHAPPDAHVMTQEVATALYANRRWVASPNTDWAHFMEYAKSHDASYIVVRDLKLADRQPDIAVVLEEGTPELELVFSYEESHMLHSVKTLVYHISKPTD